MTKLKEFYDKVLGSPKYFVAPMVEQSEKAWRILSTNHKAQVTYTPMIHAKQFVQSQAYRNLHLSQFNQKENNLIVQFCANDPSFFLEAAKLVETKCVAVDLNLGCPQHIARKGHYGSYLQHEWDLIKSIVSLASSKLLIPVTCKIRVFETIKESVEYAQMIQDAGCSMLVVHGRLREQKGHLTGKADWSKIKAIKYVIAIIIHALLNQR